MRRLVIVLMIVAIVAVAWAGGWFALAAWAEGRVSSALAEVADRGIEVDCPGREMVGFPFALKVACGETAVAERSSGSHAELAALTGGASIFAPMTAEIDIGSPARLESPLLEGPASFRWNNAAIDVGMGLNGPQTVSFDAVDLAAELPVPGLADAAFSAETAGGTLAPAEDGGTDAALSFTGLALSADETAFPPFDGAASARLSVPPRALLAGRAGLQMPLSASAVRVSLAAGDARLEAEGDLSVDAEGVLNGVMTLTVAGAEALPAFIAALPAEHQRAGNAVAGGLIAFGEATTLDGEPASRLRLEISRGKVKVGPLEVELPRLPI